MIGLLDIAEEQMARADMPPMRDVQVSIGSWYVGFLGVERKLSVDWLSPLGFLHCIAFGYHAQSQHWIVYDVSRRRTFSYAIAPADLIGWIMARQEEEGMRVLKVETIDDGPALTGLGGLYCVSGVRHLIGARSRALRPIGLWRDLVAAGAVEVFEETSHGPRAD